MDKFEELKDILTAMQDIGNAWHEEIVSLQTENQALQDKYNRLVAENKNLQDKNESL